MAKLVPVADFTRKLMEKKGGRYVYGMDGTTYTISKARMLERMYGGSDSMGDGYYCKLENGVKNFYKGICSSAYGQWAADCSAFVYWAQKQLGGTAGRTSAKNVYNNQCAQKGAMSSFDGRPGTLLFRYDSKKRRMVHVGVYCGDGYTIESEGARTGVVYRKRRNTWTHWGLAEFLDYNKASDGGNASPPEEPEQPDEPEGDTSQPDDDFDTQNVPVLRRGMRDKKKNGGAIQYLQEKLVARGYRMPRSKRRDGTYDGDFGRETYNAVRSFQRQQRIEVDGIVGKQTWTKLLGVPCEY